MLQFLVCGCGGEEESVLVATLMLDSCSSGMLRQVEVLSNVPSCESADYPGSCDRGVANGDNVLEFGFEDTVMRLSVLRSGSICLSPSPQQSSRRMRAASICAPVEVLTRADSDDRIRVGKCSEDTDFVRVFELGADSHDC